MKLRKILSVFLVLTLMMGLLCASLPAEAETTTTWLDFEAKEMPSYLSEYGWDAWSIDETTPYRMATWKNWGYVYGSTYANVRKIVVPNTGTVSFETIWGSGIFSDDAESFEFAILDKNKKMIWPESGVPYTIKAKTVDNGDGTTTTTTDGLGQYYDSTAGALAACSDSLSLTVDVTAGDEFYFVFMNASDEPTNYTATMIIRNNGTQINASGGYMCADDFTQGGTVGDTGVKWYYMYADSVELTTADPDGYTDEGGDEYTIDYGETLTPMTKISTANGDANTGWLGNGTYRKTTFVSGYNAYFQAGHSLVVRFTPEEDGHFKIGYAGMQLKNTWASGEGVDFYIVDHTGKVIYPEPGQTASIRAGTGNPFDKSMAAAVSQTNVLTGEYLDFVFVPRMATAADYTHSFYLAGSFTHPGAVDTATSTTRIDSSGRLFLGNGESQGSRNIQMFTTTDLSINKVVTGEWKEFVKLESALATAAATAEAWVNIPAEVPDWKTGTLISDMNGLDGTGTAVMMDKFGHPRFVSGNVDWTVDSVDLRTGAWQHIAFTVDAANNVATFYQNGVAVATTTLTEAALAVSGKAPVIGNDLSYASTTAFQGAVKKLALFSDVRTADEIAADMAAVSSSAEGILGYWVLNGVYADKTANSNDGTLTAVNEDWYENGVPADAEDGEYTIVHVGDNQVVTDFYNDGYQEITQWIADNAERLNIQMVVNSGDLVNYAATTSQWVDAKAGMDILKAAGIPYVYALGNHEYPDSGGAARTTEEFNDYFAIEEHLIQGEGQANETTLAYAYPKTTKISSVDDLMLLADNDTGVTSYGNTYVETMENAFYLATLGGKQYIILALEAQPRTAVVEWANTVLTALEAEYKAADTAVTTIVVEHYYIGTYGQRADEYGMFNAAERTLDVTPAGLWDDFISQHASIQLVLSGHVATGISTRTDIGANGNKVVSIMNDQSYEGNGGEGNILLLRCKADGTVIKAEYYSPILERYYQQAYQFDFDTAADSDSSLMFSLPTVSQMGTTNGSDRWYVTGMPGGALVGGSLLAAYKNYVGVRTFVPATDGSLDYTMTITGLGTSGATSTPLLEMALCKADGTILWPATGAWHTITAAITESVTVDVKEGEAVHLMIRMINKDAATSQKYINVKSTAKVTDLSGNTLSYTSTGTNTGFSYTTQGTNGWYANYIESGTSITAATMSKSYSVTYGVDGEGGTIGASTSGTWGAETCTIPAGGTIRFVATPQVGYRIVGYYVNGVYHKHSRRVLTLPMVKEDMDVKVVFAKNAVVGDANNDGVVDVLDAVHLTVGIATDAAIVDDTVCDLVDDIAATDGVDILDIDDVRALRKEILG